MRMFYSRPKVQRLALMMLASDFRYTSLVLNYLEKDINDLNYFLLGLHFQNQIASGPDLWKCTTLLDAKRTKILLLHQEEESRRHHVHGH
jgi:hypothetical protein